MKVSWNEFVCLSWDRAAGHSTPSFNSTFSSEWESWLKWRELTALAAPREQSNNQSIKEIDWIDLLLFYWWVSEPGMKMKILIFIWMKEWVSPAAQPSNKQRHQSIHKSINWFDEIDLVCLFDLASAAPAATKATQPSINTTKQRHLLFVDDWLVCCLAGPYFHSINNSIPFRSRCMKMNLLIPFQSLHKLGYFNSTW